MKKIGVLAAMLIVFLSMPAYAWDEDYYNDSHRRHRSYRPYRERYYGYGHRYYGGHHQYYDPYYDGGYYGGYREYYERHFGDRPLRFRFRSPDFEFEIGG